MTTNADKTKLVTVATYGDSILANIMKSKLEAYGVDSVLMDENSVNIVTINPEYTQNFGDIKLQVREEDVVTAKEILAGTEDIASADDSISDEGVACPYCGSKDTIVALGHSNTLTAVWMLFLSSFPFYNKKRYYCNTCKKYFKAQPSSYK